MKEHSKEAKLPKVSLVPLALLVGAVFFAQLPLCAQQTATTIQAEPEFKAIWEPVNYPEDLQLTSVFFVTPEVGWVTGDAATILHTRDGGDTWEAQSGGDPQSGGRSIERLIFVDETHGWATQTTSLHTNLFRTTDGETWEQIGTIPEHYSGYTFVSPTVGFYIDGETISRTVDGGRTWKKISACRAKVEEAGLMRNVSCGFTHIDFPLPSVGYAIGRSYDVAGVFIAKTEDGGETWILWRALPEESSRKGALFFADENTGFIATYSGKWFKTTDGGQNWRGMLVSPAGPVQFADPEVGWSFRSSGRSSFITYTADGGKRWSSRRFALPANINAFSLPRRDRGYVVGNHGMIYRYSIVPADYEMPGMVDAPMMPGIDSLLDDQLEQLDEQLEALEVSLRVASETEEYPPAAVEEGEEAQWEEGEEMGWVEECCAEQVEPFEGTLDALAAEIPVFTGKYRNLNLVSVGLRLIGQLFGQAQGLQDSFAVFKSARHPQSALAAIAEVSAQLDYLRQTTAAAFQEPSWVEPIEPEQE